MATNPRMGKVNTKMSKPGKWDAMAPKGGKAAPKAKAAKTKKAEPVKEDEETKDRKPGSGKAM
jgi:hypothetical protein